MPLRISSECEKCGTRSPAHGPKQHERKLTALGWVCLTGSWEASKWRCPDCAPSEAYVLLPLYREALERIASHSQEMTCEVHGHASYGRALGECHDIARSALEGKN